MKRPLYTLLIFLSIGCNNTTENLDTNTVKEFTIGKFSFDLPSTYVIYYPDSINKHEGYILRDNCPKLKFNTGGLGTLEPMNLLTNNKEMTVIKDTIQNFLKVIAYCNNTPSLGLTILNMIKKDSAIIDFIEDTSNTLINHKYEYIFNAFADTPSDNICLTNNEKTIFIEAFKKGRINK